MTISGPEPRRSEPGTTIDDVGRRVERQQGLMKILMVAFEDDRFRDHRCKDFEEDADDCSVCWDVAGEMIRSYEGLHLCERCHGGGLEPAGVDGVNVCSECGGRGEIDPEDT
jgi:hypothetical protein